MSHEDKVVLRVNRAFIPNVNLVTRNYYFFHLFCPYVKHFKKKEKKKESQHEQTTYLASSWCQEIARNWRRMQYPMQKMPQMTQNKCKQRTLLTLVLSSPKMNAFQIIWKNEIVLKHSLLIYSILWQFLCPEAERCGSIVAPFLNLKLFSIPVICSGHWMEDFPMLRTQ